jgi:hypothetical protein
LDSARKNINHTGIIMAEQETYNADAAAAQGQPQTGVPEINLGDFSVMIAIIDTVAKRGGFEGPELSDVGTLRQRLVTFVEYHKPQDDAGNPADGPAVSGDESQPETLSIDEAEDLVEEPAST